jgi:hypothetical protein
VIAEHAGQKNRHGKTTMILFRNVSYECIEEKSSIRLLLMMSIGND